MADMFQKNVTKNLTIDEEEFKMNDNPDDEEITLEEADDED